MGALSWFVLVVVLTCLADAFERRRKLFVSEVRLLAGKRPNRFQSCPKCYFFSGLSRINSDSLCFGLIFLNPWRPAAARLKPIYGREYANFNLREQFLV
jgi:hypothetical protein